MTRMIAVSMAKGGVGKTTTSVNLAHGLAASGRRVLLVDCDTQNQVGLFLGVKPTHGLYEFITGKDERGQPVARMDALFAARPNLWILSGGIKLVELKNWLGEQPREQRQTVLKNAFVTKKGALDYLIFDCAPGWDVLSVNILVAAREVICPVALQAPAFEGLKTFFSYLLSAQKLNDGLQLRYVLPTMFDRRTRQSHLLLKQLHRLFRKQYCDPIPHNVRLSEAAGLGKTIFEHAPDSPGAAGYKKMLRRVIHDQATEP